MRRVALPLLSVIVLVGLIGGPSVAGGRAPSRLDPSRYPEASGGAPSRPAPRIRPVQEPPEFPYGVGANDVTATTARLWTRTTASTVRLFLSKEPTFAHSVKQLVSVSPGHDGTVSVPMKGLTAGTTYYYKFRTQAGVESRVGAFGTAPAPSADVSFDFAFSGDQDGTGGTGNPCVNQFESFQTIADTPPAFYVNLGDTIYADSSCHTADATLDQYRQSYRDSFSFDAIRNLRATIPFWTQWDDHEVQNDFDVQTVDPTLLANGRQAFMEYDNMAKPSPNLGFYRHFRWGQEAEVFVLDERSFRTTEADRLDADGNGTEDCQNAVTAQPDLAPSLNQGWRDFFAAELPGSGLDQPVPQQCTDDLNAVDRTMLGQAQRDQFLADLAASTARFKLIMNEDPIQQFFALPYDRWEGYRWERDQVLSFIDTNAIQNVVWLTTDVHAFIAHTVDYNTDTPGSSGGVQGMVDYTVGPIATDTFRAEINQTVGGDAASSVRAFLLSVNLNTCSELGGDGNPTAPFYGYGKVSIDASTHTLSVVPLAYDGRKIAGNGVPGVGIDEFCFDYTLNSP